MRVFENRDAEPAWDEVSFYLCDFRPHFDGDFVNFCTIIEPQNSRQETEVFVQKCATNIAGWIEFNRGRFGAGDRFQIVVGWPKSIRKTGRQIIKAGGDWDDLERIRQGGDLRYFRGWWTGIFPEDNHG